MILKKQTGSMDSFNASCEGLKGPHFIHLFKYLHEEVCHKTGPINARQLVTEKSGHSASLLCLYCAKDQDMFPQVSELLSIIGCSLKIIL